MSSNVEKFSLDELCSLVDLPRRTIRYYIQQGLMDRPEGAKRGSYYLRRHLDQLLEIQKWQKAGLSLDRIRELLAGAEGEGPLPPPRRRRPGDVEVWSHLLIQDGVELHIEPGQSGLTPEQVRELSRGIMALVKKINRKESTK
jgi:DNA-binding transcriptional MerR regulator